MAKNGKQVAKTDGNGSLVVQDEPDYLTGKEKLGTEALGKGDYKVPRIKLLQPLNPEVKTFQGKAIPGEFWHTGANISLGSEFLFIPCIVGKRVVVWRPRDDGNGGILAFSRNGVDWVSGANQTFDVRVKGSKDPIKWSTGKNVQASGLLEFGTSNPDNPQSAPAATMAYEYLCLLPDHLELSPVVLGVMKTGVVSAKALNTQLLSARKPTTSIVIRAFADEVSKGRDSWHIPKFDRHGFASRELFVQAQDIANRHAEYETEIEQDTDTLAEVDDKVPY